jgi:hypothetical protein
MRATAAFSSVADAANAKATRVSQRGDRSADSHRADSSSQYADGSGMTCSWKKSYTL